MKSHYFSVWWRAGLSLFGASLMVFSAESDPPWVVARDEHFFLDFTVACITVWVTFAVQERTILWVDRLVTFRRRTRAYYIDRYTLQFVLSMLPTMLCAMIMAFLSVYVLTGRFLWDTLYFVYDIYMVGLGIVGVQVILGFIHYIWSKDQFEEVELVTEEGLRVYDSVGRQARPRQLNPALQTYLLENVADQYADEVATDQGIVQGTLPPTKKDRLQWEVIRRLDWSDIAAFYSKDNSTYLVRWDGHEEVLDASLSNIKRLMDTSIYFSGAKSLIAHHNAVIEVIKLGNGRVKLIVEPSIPVDTGLSRVATQQFRKWYLA